MKPEDVPDELVEKFDLALDKAIGGRIPDEYTTDDLRIAFAAVLPAHEVMVRAQIAAEIEARTPSTSALDDMGLRPGLRRAIRIARGDR